MGLYAGSVGRQHASVDGEMLGKTRSLRLIAAMLLLGLSACGEKSAPGQPAARPETSTSAAPSAGDDTAVDDRIACATGGETALSMNCRIERTQTDEGLVITIRHPDGGFRRLLVVKDGRGVVPADGAEPAQVVLAGQNQIDVTIGRDRYRLPAVAKAATP